MINRNEVRSFLYNGEPIVGHTTDDLDACGDQIFYIHHPFRIIYDGKGIVKFAPIVMQEEWIKFFPKYSHSFMETSTLESVKDGYLKVQSETFSGIILPEQSRIII